MDHVSILKKNTASLFSSKKLLRLNVLCIKHRERKQFYVRLWVLWEKDTAKCVEVSLGSVGDHVPGP